MTLIFSKRSIHANTQCLPTFNSKSLNMPFIDTIRSHVGSFFFYLVLLFSFYTSTLLLCKENVNKQFVELTVRKLLRVSRYERSQHIYLRIYCIYTLSKVLNLKHRYNYSLVKIVSFHRT